MKLAVTLPVVLATVIALPAQTHPAGFPVEFPVWMNPRLKALSATSDRAVEEIRRLLAQAKPSRVSYLADFKFDEQSMTKLPPTLGIHVSEESLERARLAESKGKSWADTDPDARIKPYGVFAATVRGKDFLEKLEIEARGDFNGDGIEDIVIRTGDALLQGTYRATRVFILTRRKPGEKLTTLQQWP
jgi:hypothetical protein